MRHAVFPGGARVRPQLTLAVARACGADPAAALPAAVAVELIHCASLVHDDLPCFDDADERRGQPTVHRAFDEATAVLVGDALIVLAFELMSAECASASTRLAVVQVLAAAVGANDGLAAGQAAELEPHVDVAVYHRRKTGSLFEAAVEIGAILGGISAREWLPVGEALGRAYQLADDLVDEVGDATSAGKPIGQDLLHGRPNAARALGLAQAFARVKEQLYAAIAGVPPCRGRDELRAWLVHTAAELYAAHRGPQLAQRLREVLGTSGRAHDDLASATVADEPQP
jgi:geranylgeranyl diphosphate synthase type II